MPRKLILILTSLFLLVQGLASAWAAPMLPSSTQQEATLASDMPCHSTQAAEEQTTDDNTGDCCCGDHACAQLCASASQTLPASGNVMDELIAEHFSAIRTSTQALPAHLLSRLRPPIVTPG